VTNSHWRCNHFTTWFLKFNGIQCNIIRLKNRMEDGNPLGRGAWGRLAALLLSHLGTMSQV
jgi:hypothetical protein